MASSAIKPLGIIAIIYGGLQVLLALVIMILGSALPNFMNWVTDLPKTMVWPVNLTVAVLMVVMIVILINGALWLLGGIGLLEMRNWGRILLIIGAILALFSFPIGTALGIIYLVFMFNKNLKRMMR